MTKRAAPKPPPTPPTISRAEGKHRLEVMREKAKSLCASGRVSDEVDEPWANTTLDYIRQIFGSDTPHVHTFIGQVQVRMSGLGFGGHEPDYEAQNAREMKRRINVINQLIELIDMEASFSPPTTSQTTQFDFWAQLHPEVIQHAKSRYDGGHYADSVEAALKHVNAKVKDLVFRKTGKENDGASLMKSAFSPNGPIISLDDLSTESGRNIQQGYMEIFAGSMTGIRNPKAHANIQIDSKRAMHLLFLASLLLYKLDERL